MTMNLEPLSRAAHLKQLKAILASEGVRAALKYMNEHTAHRFSAIFLFENESTLHNLFFYDRENPGLEQVQDIPIQASYCVFVRRLRRNFAVSDSRADERVAEHPKKDEYRSYVGIPLLDEMGRMYGTMCHFDYEPAEVDPISLEMMEAIGPLIKLTHPVS